MRDLSEELACRLNPVTGLPWAPSSPTSRRSTSPMRSRSVSPRRRRRWAWDEEEEEDEASATPVRRYEGVAALLYGTDRDDGRRDGDWRPRLGRPKPAEGAGGPPPSRMGRDIDDRPCLGHKRPPLEGAAGKRVAKDASLSWRPSLAATHVPVSAVADEFRPRLRRDVDSVSESLGYDYVTPAGTARRPLVDDVVPIRKGKPESRIGEAASASVHDRNVITGHFSDLADCPPRSRGRLRQKRLLDSSSMRTTIAGGRSGASAGRSALTERMEAAALDASRVWKQHSLSERRKRVASMKTMIQKRAGLLRAHSKPRKPKRRGKGPPLKGR
eukprot:PLAT4040.1.p1 GENE.PLAT4040.1~~PLAT4040.1.p1  ORF type:complete len:376 (+),score=4.40 PLAT4040.1:143-1129(+)